MDELATNSITFTTRLPRADAYFALFESTGWNDVYRCTTDDLTHTLHASWHVESAYREEVLIAAGRLVSDGRLYAVVFDVIVAPDWQRRGIGSRIMNRLLERCQSAGIRDILLFAAKGTQSFYRRHGFTPRLPDAPGMMIRRSFAE